MEIDNLGIDILGIDILALPPGHELPAGQILTPGQSIILNIDPQDQCFYI